MIRFVWNRRRSLRGRRYFWHLKAGNGEIIAQGHSRGYVNKADMLHAIELVQGSGIAVIEEAR